MLWLVEMKAIQLSVSLYEFNCEKFHLNFKTGEKVNEMLSLLVKSGLNLSWFEYLLG